SPLNCIKNVDSDEETSECRSAKQHKRFEVEKSNGAICFGEVVVASGRMKHIGQRRDIIIIQRRVTGRWHALQFIRDRRWLQRQRIVGGIPQLARCVIFQIFWSQCAIPNGRTHSVAPNRATKVRHATSLLDHSISAQESLYKQKIAAVFFL